MHVYMYCVSILILLLWGYHNKVLSHMLLYNLTRLSKGFMWYSSTFKLIPTNTKLVECLLKTIKSYMGAELLTHCTFFIKG